MMITKHELLSWWCTTIEYGLK